MAKPILVIRMNGGFSNAFPKIVKSVRAQLNDEYHVLTIGEETDVCKMEVFNVDKEEPINYSQLKKLINKEVETIQDATIIE